MPYSISFGTIASSDPAVPEVGRSGRHVDVVTDDDNTTDLTFEATYQE